MDYKKEYIKAKISNIIYKTIFTGDISKIVKIGKKIGHSKLANYVSIEDLLLLGTVIGGKHKTIRLNEDLVWFIWDNVNGKKIGQWFSTYRKAEEAYIKMFGFVNKNKYTIKHLNTLDSVDRLDFSYMRFCGD